MNIFLNILMLFIGITLGTDFLMPFWPIGNPPNINTHTGIWGGGRWKIRVFLGKPLVTFVLFGVMLVWTNDLMITLFLGHLVGQIIKFIWGKSLLRKK